MKWPFLIIITMMMYQLLRRSYISGICRVTYFSLIFKRCIHFSSRGFQRIYIEEISYRYSVFLWILLWNNYQHNSFNIEYKVFNYKIIVGFLISSLEVMREREIDACFDWRLRCLWLNLSYGYSTGTINAILATQSLCGSYTQNKASWT